MATHRPHDTAQPSRHELELIVGVFDACEDLKSGRHPITPESVSRWLGTRAFPGAPALEEVCRSLTLLQKWRADKITRDLINHRRQLAHLEVELQGRRRQLEDDHTYLQMMIENVEGMLCECGRTAGKERDRSLQ